MKTLRFLFTRRSDNIKTGNMPVCTAPRPTCPPSCPFYRNCYASFGPLNIWWKKVSQGKAGIPFARLCQEVSQLPPGQIWRYGQAGDLPGNGEEIDAEQLAKLVRANQGKKGFTYTHKKPVGSNRKAIKSANAHGFTVNLSANGLCHADKLAKLGIAPVASVVPTGTANKFKTLAGRPGIVCPAQTRDNMTCARCGLCAKPTRKLIIGFLPHGPSARRINAIAQES